MIWLLKVTLSFLSLQAHADQLEWVRHSQYGTEQIVIKYNSPNGKTLLFTNTNIFTRAFPARVGFYERLKAGSMAKEVSRLVLTAQVSQVVPNLRVSPHAGKIYLAGKEVGAGTAAYAEALKIVKDEVNDAAWNFIEGEQVSFQGFEAMTIEEFKTGKSLFKKVRAPIQSCARYGVDVICHVKSGMVYVPEALAKHPFLSHRSPQQMIQPKKAQ